VLDGIAVLEFEDKTVTLTKGDYINILAHQKHRVLYTANPTIWLAVFYK
jgi:cupin 2 domain-containing protein